MIYESQITYTSVNDKGVEVTKKENYIVDNQELFAFVENKLFGEFGGYDNLDVAAIKRSRIKEIANIRTSDDDLIWCAELQDVFHDDEGNEKYSKYKILLFAKTFDSAKAFISEYMKQAYDMSLVSLKLTNFMDVI